MQLKNYKSQGQDGIQGKIMKMLNDHIITYIQKLMVHIWEKEELPKSWNIAVIYPIYKKR